MKGINAIVVGSFDAGETCVNGVQAAQSPLQSTKGPWQALLRKIRALLRQIGRYDLLRGS